MLLYTIRDKMKFMKNERKRKWHPWDDLCTWILRRLDSTFWRLCLQALVSDCLTLFYITSHCLHCLKLSYIVWNLRSSVNCLTLSTLSLRCLHKIRYTALCVLLGPNYTMTKTNLSCTSPILINPIHHPVKRAKNQSFLPRGAEGEAKKLFLQRHLWAVPTVDR